MTVSGVSEEDARFQRYAVVNDRGPAVLRTSEVVINHVECISIVIEAPEIAGQIQALYRSKQHSRTIERIQKIDANTVACSEKPEQLRKACLVRWAGGTPLVIKEHLPGGCGD